MRKKFKIENVRFEEVMLIVVLILLVRLAVAIWGKV